MLTRGTVKATPLERRRGQSRIVRAQSESSEVVVYEIDQSSLNEVKKLVFLPERYVAKRPRLVRPG